MRPGISACLAGQLHRLLSLSIMAGTAFLVVRTLATE
jgi:hypothetical protein